MHHLIPLPGLDLDSHKPAPAIQLAQGHLDPMGWCRLFNSLWDKCFLVPKRPPEPEILPELQHASHWAVGLAWPSAANHSIAPAARNFQKASISTVLRNFKGKVERETPECVFTYFPYVSLLSPHRVDGQICT